MKYNNQTVEDVAMIARNAIDTIIRMERRQWVGLTDEELIELSESGLYLWELWRAIEAKLKEKNT